MSTPRISLVVAMARNRVIGRDGGLPWHLPDELKHFKRVTMGAPILMGRRTHAAIGRALPGRRNLVLSRDPDLRLPEGCERVASVDEALRETADVSWLHVIGGGQLYELFLPLAQVLHLTVIEAEIEGDTHFPAVDFGAWALEEDRPHPADERHAFAFRLQRWARR